MAAKRTGPGPGSGDTARAMRAAGEQIDLAIAESRPSVEQLGEALQRLAALLGNSAAASPEWQAVRAELARAVTSLQFHDRMTQHLTHVRNYLADGADGLDAGADPASHDWTQLNRRLPSRLLTDAARPAVASGDIELF